MSDSNEKKDSKVIDISERLQAKQSTSPLQKLKVRLDLEQAKVAIPASIMSILIVVTLANSKLLSGEPAVESATLASEGTVIQSRGIASVPTGTSDDEDRLVKEMASRSLSEAAAIGRKPSALEQFAFEQLEGKYAVRVNDGKLSELQLSPGSADPIQFDTSFIEKNRSLLPVAYDKSVRVGTERSDTEVKETYHLVNQLSMPMAEIQVRLSETHHLLGMRVIPTNVAGR